MKRSNNKQKEMTAALYVRLSRDDNLIRTTISGFI